MVEDSDVDAATDSPLSRRDLLRHMVARVAGVLSEGRRRPGTLEVPYIPYTVRPEEEEGT